MTYSLYVTQCCPNVAKYRTENKETMFSLFAHLRNMFVMSPKAEKDMIEKMPISANYLYGRLK